MKVWNCCFQSLCVYDPVMPARQVLRMKESASSVIGSKLATSAHKEKLRS